jgi:hypothetical protein
MLRQPAADSSPDLLSLARALGDGPAVELGAALQVLSALGIALTATSRG